MLKKLYKVIVIVTLSATCLFGCGKTSDEEKELANFSTSVLDFANYIKEVDGKINMLDVNKQESSQELLEILDDMDEKFSAFAELNIPARYSAVEELAMEASENMSKAVSYYHTAYEVGEFNESYANAAYEYYTRAMIRITYIGYVLEGEEIPQGENVIIYEESNDSSVLDKWLSGDEDTQETVSETIDSETAE